MSLLTMLPTEHIATVPGSESRPDGQCAKSVALECQCRCPAGSPQRAAKNVACEGAHDEEHQQPGHFNKDTRGWSLAGFYSVSSIVSFSDPKCRARGKQSDPKSLGGYPKKKKNTHH